MAKFKRPVTIVQDTMYPYSGDIRFRIDCAEAVEFSLSLRIPGWSEKPEIKINGALHSGRPVAGIFHSVKRNWQPGDVIELSLHPTVRQVERGIAGRALAYGPLLLSHPIKAKVEAEQLAFRTSPDFPAYQLFPDTPWAYAVDAKDSSFELGNDVTDDCSDQKLWNSDTTPLRVRVPAIEIDDWKVERGHTPPLPESPIRGKEKEIELVAMGSTLLRMSVFPELKGTDE